MGIEYFLPMKFGYKLLLALDGKMNYIERHCLNFHPHFLLTRFIVGTNAFKIDDKSISS
jgi:hypothetical protein